MNTEDKFKRHLGLPVSVKLKNARGEEDEFNFRPLKTEKLLDMLDLSKEIDKSGDITKEQANHMISLIKQMVELSYPELSKEIIEDFISYNLMKLLPIFFEVHGWDEDTENISKKLADLRKKKEGK